MQYNFDAGVGGKIGFRVAGGQRYADFTALDLSATVTATPISSSCERISPSGISGTACSTSYNWVTGREYRLRLRPLALDDRDWKATVMDMETAAETEIGRIHLADALPLTGYGGLREMPSGQTGSATGSGRRTSAARSRRRRCGGSGPMPATAATTRRAPRWSTVLAAVRSRTGAAAGAPCSSRGGIGSVTLSPAPTCP